VQVDDQVHEYGRNADTTHDLPQSAFLSTESKAAFRSTNATCNGCWNSLWISVNRRSARIASSVERQRVNPTTREVYIDGVVKLAEDFQAMTRPMRIPR